MENKFRKPTRLRGTPAHKYIHLYTIVVTAACCAFGYGVVMIYPDIFNENSRYTRISKWFEDPEQEALRKKLNKNFLLPPVKEEGYQKSLDAAGRNR